MLILSCTGLCTTHPAQPGPVTLKMNKLRGVGWGGVNPSDPWPCFPLPCCCRDFLVPELLAQGCRTSLLLLICAIIVLLCLTPKQQLQVRAGAQALWWFGGLITWSGDRGRGREGENKLQPCPWLPVGLPNWASGVSQQNGKTT